MKQLEGRGGRLQGEPLAITSRVYCEVRAKAIATKTSMISIRAIVTQGNSVSDPQRAIPRPKLVTRITAIWVATPGDLLRFHHRNQFFTNAMSG